MAKWIGLTGMVTAVAVMTSGCAQAPSAAAAGVEEEDYTVTPASVKVKAGIVAGEVTELKVAERVDHQFATYGGDSCRPGTNLLGSARKKEACMQVVAFSTPSYPDWRWRIVNYAGEMVEESSRMFPTIREAVAAGARRLQEMNVSDVSVRVNPYRPTSYLRGR